jgi:hypothetical protein
MRGRGRERTAADGVYGIQEGEGVAAAARVSFHCSYCLSTGGS